MCFGGICQIVNLYEGTTINSDSYFMNSSAAGTYGIIGMGPNSPFWQSYAVADS